MIRIRSLASWGDGYPFAVLCVAAATGLVLPLRGILSHVEIALLYVPVIGLVARMGSIRASALASLVALGTIDFLFVRPYYSLAISVPRDLLTLAIFLLVALLSGMQTGRLSQREEAALRREADLGMLNRLSARLLSGESAERVAAAIVTEVVSVLGASRAAVFVSGERGRAAMLAEAGDRASGRAEEAFADWVLANDKAVGLSPTAGIPMVQRPASVGPSDAVDGAVADGVYLPLQTGNGLEGVLYARPLVGVRWFGSAQVRLLVSIANLSSAYLERLRLQREAAQTVALRESDRLKGTLVSSVSHELKTPLSAITATVTGLLEDDVPCDAERVRTELRAVVHDLTRLDASIRDLLDLSRLESDSWVARPDVYEVGEILGTVSDRLPAVQRGRVAFALPDEPLAVRVDYSQMARALSNLVENALAYSPAGSPVRVSARLLGPDVVVCVEDEGPGVPDAEKSAIFEKFRRGATASAAPSGTGLGLAITREIVAIHGGRVWVEDVGERGARFSVSMRVASEEPT